MKKHLIFYLYVTDDFFQRKTNLVTVECLRNYAHIFDYAEFYLSLDDVSNYELIHQVEDLLLDVGFRKDVTFHIHQNDSFRESRIVKEQIADKLGSFKQDELIFFAHGKGFTNLERYEERSMLHWLIGCYYMSLEFAKEAEDLITGMNTFCTYGSFPLVMTKKQLEGDLLAKDELYLGRIKYHWCFSGTFFWLYPIKLLDHLKIFGPEIPDMFDRYYSEKFLGNVMSYESNACGHNLMYLYSGNNMYNDGVAEDCIRFILRDDESMQKYYDFFNRIVATVHEKYGL